MQYLLIDRTPKMITTWLEFFHSENNVTVIQSDITKVEVNAVVSPANSFGFMDGGLDYALSDRFGWDLQKELQKRIRALPEGELLVGKAMVIETGDATIPYLISAPTMRVPMSFNIATSVNAYFAMKAILIAARAHPHIKSVAIPGLCTGVGKMQPIIAARQMYIAFNEIENGQNLKFNNFSEAQQYHWATNPQGKLYD